MLRELQSLLLQHADAIRLGQASLWNRIVIVVDGKATRTECNRQAPPLQGPLYVVRVPRDIRGSRLIQVLRRLALDTSIP